MSPSARAPGGWPTVPMLRVDDSSRANLLASCLRDLCSFFSSYKGAVRCEADVIALRRFLDALGCIKDDGTLALGEVRWANLRQAVAQLDPSVAAAPAASSADGREGHVADRARFNETEQRREALRKLHVLQAAAGFAIRAADAGPRRFGLRAFGVPHTEAPAQRVALAMYPALLSADFVAMLGVPNAFEDDVKHELSCTIDFDLFFSVEDRRKGTAASMSDSAALDHLSAATLASPAPDNPRAPDASPAFAAPRASVRSVTSDASSDSLRAAKNRSPSTARVSDSAEAKRVCLFELTLADNALPYKIAQLEIRLAFYHARCIARGVDMNRRLLHECGIVDGRQASKQAAIDAFLLR